jgi:type II secretory pathway pseudopilin PulG
MPAYQQAPTSAPAPAADGYLESVSNESLEVLQHFGAETPALLNRYACVVEDALLTQAQQTAQALQHLQVTQNQLTNAHTVIEAAAEDNAAYHTLLTNPDLLSNYVREFFGPNGPYPVETAQDRLAAEVAAGEAQFAPQAPVYQRPQLDMPAPDVQAGSGDSEFWNVFSQISDRRPDMAWQVLSQATPEALRSKILVSEA